MQNKPHIMGSFLSVLTPCCVFIYFSKTDKTKLHVFCLFCSLTQTSCASLSSDFTIIKSLAFDFALHKKQLSRKEKATALVAVFSWKICINMHYAVSDSNGMTQ